MKKEIFLIASESTEFNGLESFYTFTDLKKAELAAVERGYSAERIIYKLIPIAKTKTFKSQIIVL